LTWNEQGAHALPGAASMRALVVMRQRVGGVPRRCPPCLLFPRRTPPRPTRHTHPACAPGVSEGLFHGSPSFSKGLEKPCDVRVIGVGRKLELIFEGLN